MTPRKKTQLPEIVHQPGAQSYERFNASIKERVRTVQDKAAFVAGISEA